MSYAKQFFGVKQNQILQYAEQLAFFGEESYVYKNASLMKEIIASEIALSNPTTAFYAYLWAREKGYNAIDYFTPGLVIALYNTELDMTFHFVLVGFNADGSALFINREPCITGTASTASGLEALNYENYDLINYLNGEKNWFGKWENKPSSVPATTTDANPYRRLRFVNGFLSGIDIRVKKLLKTFKEGHNFPILPISYADFMNPILVDLGYKSNLHIINENCKDYYYKYCNPNEQDDSVKVGEGMIGCLIEEVTADQITRTPNYRAGFTATGSSNTVEKIQEAGASSVCPILNVGIVNLKIQF